MKNVYESDVVLLLLVSSIRTPVLIPGRLELTETNLMHFKYGS